MGATDIAAIVGVSPYLAPIDVYRRRVEGIEQAVTDPMKWGLIFEETICALYSEQTGRVLQRRNELVHPEYDFIRGHPDRLIVGEPGVFDAKSTWYGGGKYGEPGTDQVPPHVRVQMLIYCGLAKRQFGDVGNLRGRPPLDIYTVPADAALYEGLIAEAVRFEREHIIPRIPPPADGTEAYRDYLRSLYPVSQDIEMVATPEQGLLVEELAAAKSAKAEAETRERSAQNRIAEVMGEASVLLAPAGRVTFKSQTRKSYVVAESTFRAMRLYAAHEEEAAA